MILTPQTTQAAEETLAALEAVAEPVRSAGLGILAAKIRAAAWSGHVRAHALDLAAAAEARINPAVDLLEGQQAIWGGALK